MNTVSSDRRYKLKIRSDRQRETRERIVAATEALHREVGPARTTIAEIARRAGVERLTVYNHFPELGELLLACQAHFLAGHKPPDISPAGATAKDVYGRLESALVRLYGWFRANEEMERNVHRDRDLLPELDQLLRDTSDRVFDAAADAYAELIARRQGVARVRTMVRVALDFRTWQLLTRDGASDREAARLLARAIACVT
ncbi:MAG TPA: TetR/AcrR family transcriptional regulator [Candidatus Dormibacteraeota bacterium]|nr:TetR/AcrR family transcriptional regulator [Candidatus Dormibacteraeota bacterium]